MKNIKSAILSDQLNSFTSMLIGKVGYYNGSLYRFEKTSNGFTLVIANDDFAPSVLIVSPKYYSETVESLPSVSSSELRKLLKLKIDSKDIAIVQRKTEQEIKINVWHFLDDIPTTWITIPETFLISSTLNENDILLYTAQDSQERYVANISGCVMSAAKSKLMSSFSSFCASVGIYSENTRQVEQNDFTNILVNGLAKVNKLSLSSFVPKFNSSSLLTLLKKQAIPLAALGVFYILSTSSYLYLKNEYLASQSQSIKNEAKSLLELQSLTQRKLQLYNTLLKENNNKVNPNYIWEVLAPVFAIAKINSITFQNSIIKVRGQSKTASDILELIVVNYGVKNAKFDSPVRKTQGSESFSISFELINKQLMSKNVSDVKNG